VIGIQHRLADVGAIFGVHAFILSGRFMVTVAILSAVLVNDVAEIHR